VLASTAAVVLATHTRACCTPCFACPVLRHHPSRCPWVWRSSHSGHRFSHGPIHGCPEPGRPRSTRASQLEVFEAIITTTTATTTPDQHTRWETEVEDCVYGPEVLQWHILMHVSLQNCTTSYSAMYCHDASIQSQDG